MKLESIVSQSCIDGLEMYKKRDARAKLLFCLSKPIAFLVSVAVVVPTVVIKKFCCHGNVKSHFSLFQQHISLANKEMFDLKHSVSKIVNPNQKISRKSQY